MSIHSAPCATPVPVASLRRLAAATLCVSAAILLGACGEKEEPKAGAPPIRPVKTLVVAGGALGGTRTFPGRVDASRKVELSFRVHGKLQELPVKEGQEVKQGDVVAKLEPVDFQQVVDDQKARFDKAKADFDRARELIKRNFISRQDYDALEAQVKSLTAALNRAKNDLSYTVLKSPFDGRVAQRYVENFQEVQAKEPVMALQDINTLEVRFSIPENVMRSVRRGAESKAVDFVTARFDGAGDRSFPLEFKEVSTRADPETQTFQATFILPAPEGVTLLPGMTASVDVNMDEFSSDTAAQFSVPVSAVVGDVEKSPTVWLVNEESMTVSPRTVEVGKMSGENIAVQGGLEDGERVVVAGVSFLREGMKVRLMEHKEQATQ